MRVMEPESLQRTGRVFGRTGLLVAALLIGACAGNPYEAQPPVPQPSPRLPDAREPAVVPPPASTPPAPQRPATQRSHPRYAPPPPEIGRASSRDRGSSHGKSHSERKQARE